MKYFHRKTAYANKERFVDVGSLTMTIMCKNSVTTVVTIPMSNTLCNDNAAHVQKGGDR